MTPTPSPKDWSEDVAHENGLYLCRCVGCRVVFVGHKRRVVCRECFAESKALFDSAPTSASLPEATWD